MRAVIPRLFPQYAARADHLLNTTDRADCITTNGFTIGKEYPVRRVAGGAFDVVNDNGHERVVALGPSAHIIWTGLWHPHWTDQKVAGYFEGVE